MSCLLTVSGDGDTVGGEERRLRLAAVMVVVGRHTLSHKEGGDIHLVIVHLKGRLQFGDGRRIGMAGQ
jgi:hypothetical protein